MTKPMVLIPLSEYNALVAEATGDGPLFVDSAWLSTRYGKSPEWWADRARYGQVKAQRDGTGSPWIFERRSCFAYLEALVDSNTMVNDRAPWKWLQTLQSVPQDLPPF